MAALINIVTRSLGRRERALGDGTRADTRSMDIAAIHHQPLASAAADRSSTRGCRQEQRTWRGGTRADTWSMDSAAMRSRLASSFCSTRASLSPAAFRLLSYRAIVSRSGPANVHGRQGVRSKCPKCPRGYSGNECVRADVWQGLVDARCGVCALYAAYGPIEDGRDSVLAHAIGPTQWA